MGTRKIEQGEIGRNVQAQVHHWREQKRLSIRQLSDRLGQVGRPILPTGISKIESGARRVDVDDLVALAIALEVNPLRLLKPVPAVPEDLSEEDLSKAAEAAWDAWEQSFAHTHELIERRERG
jgi:transcriptional regulator with XRE-family HTH domain